MSRFTFVPGAGYLYGGVAGDYGVTCPGCDTLFEAPTADLAQSGARSCLENHQRGSDAFDHLTLDA